MKLNEYEGEKNCTRVVSDNGNTSSIITSQNDLLETHAVPQAARGPARLEEGAELSAARFRSPGNLTKV